MILASSCNTKSRENLRCGHVLYHQADGGVVPCTEHTLRFYTDKGLLPCQRDSGNRWVFNEESVN